MDQEFKVGDKVWCINYGNGAVDSLWRLEGPWAIRVLFDNGRMSYYTVNGGFVGNSIYPSLYHGHDLVLTVAKPEYEYKVL